MGNLEGTLEHAAESQNIRTSTPVTPASPMDAFTGAFEPTEVSFSYKFGLAVVAFAMVLLSAIYLGLIALTAYGVYYHVRYDSAMLSGHGGGWVRLAAWVTPVVGGVVLVFFMVKPYFAAKPPEPPKYSLTPESDPGLFAFISRICELVRAPLPTRVDVDCQVNASASFRRGLLSMRGNDVVLTIGLPLVAGLTMQEFAGVLAHEFGHFAQGAGMRLTYIVRQTNSWFARVVYQRDEWDVRLNRVARSIDIRIGIFIYLICFCVWLSRRVLWVLMHVGHAVSCFMLRQMEYDADSYETKLAGSTAFASTSAKLRDLNAASQLAFHKMRESWQNRRLPENLPRFIDASTQNLPPEVKQKMDEALAKAKTRIFDTHPCDADRVKAASALNQPGVFHLTAPASELFQGFSELSKGATRFYYEHELELAITDQNLVAQEVADNESRSEAEGSDALRKYFFGLKLVHRPIVISESIPLFESAESAAAILKQARLTMEHSKFEMEQALKDFGAAESLFQRGLEALRQDNQQATSKASASFQKIIPVFEAFEARARVRLESAFQLLNHPQVAGKIKDAAALQQETTALITVFARLVKVFPLLQELQQKHGAFDSALEAATKQSLAPRANQRINVLTPELQKLIDEIQSSLAGVPYPFRHAQSGIPLNEFARSGAPASHKLEALYNNCSCHLARLMPLYHRVLGRLTFIALQVEEHLPA